MNFPASTPFLLAASIILCLYSHVQAAQSMTKLFVAYGSVSSNAAPLWIAQEQGFFNKYGMDAEPVFIIGGESHTGDGRRTSRGWFHWARARDECSDSRWRPGNDPGAT